MPSEYFSTALRLTDESEEECAFKIARFVQHAEAMQELIQAEVDAGRPPVAGVIVDVKENGIQMNWLDREFVEHHVDLPFTDKE